MRVDFDLSLLSQGILGEFRRAMAAMQSAIPVLALQVDPWLTKELERRQKAAKGEAVKPVTMLVPLLDEKELSRGMACSDSLQSSSPFRPVRQSAQGQISRKYSKL